jgi:hypothetical protein
VIAPSPKKKSKHIGWMLDNDYSEGDGKDGKGNADDDSDDSGDDFVTPKRNKKTAKRTRKKRKTTINPGLVFGAVEFEQADDDNSGAPVANEPKPKKYSMTEAKHWKQVSVGGGSRRAIDPVPYTGEGELFGVKL